MGDVVRVFAYSAEQGGTSGVLPGQPEAVNARDLGHATLVHDAAALVDPGQVYP